MLTCPSDEGSPPFGACCSELAKSLSESEHHFGVDGMLSSLFSGMFDRMLKMSPITAPIISPPAAPAAPLKPSVKAPTCWEKTLGGYCPGAQLCFCQACGNRFVYRHMCRHVHRHVCCHVYRHDCSELHSYTGVRMFCANALCECSVCLSICACVRMHCVHGYTYVCMNLAGMHKCCSKSY